MSSLKKVCLHLTDEAEQAIRKISDHLQQQGIIGDRATALRFAAVSCANSISTQKPKVRRAS